MSPEVTWVAIAASLVLGLAGACVFAFAVNRDYFKDFEDAKYQVFWSDIEEHVEAIGKEAHDTAAGESR